MRILQSYPIVKLCGLFIIGVSCFGYIELKPDFLLTCIAMLLLITLGMHFFYNRIFLKPTYSWIFGFSISLIFIVLGYAIASKDNQPMHEDHFGKKVLDKKVIIARIIEPLQEKSNTYKAILSIDGIKGNSGIQNCSGKCIAYIEKNLLAQQLVYGDIIVFQSDVSEVPEPGNPHQFNYKKYLTTKSIFHQTYIPSSSWKFLRKGETNLFYKYSYQIRDMLVKVFYNNGLSGDEYAVATALILGYDDKISYELAEKFSHAGAIHVLCVSGLHVGIIYLIVFALLSPLVKFKKGKLLRIIIIVAIIWCFAMITGLSPSVVRSATMFSFVAMANIVKRKNNIYNTLALSAFVLLIANSNLLYDVGFQLSYSAVIGIVAIQPGLYRKWKIKNWFFRKVWAITTVSIAAQIGTLPLVLTYFNQFPNYFLISNLVVIPLATLILYAGVIVIVTAPIKIISMFFAKVLSWLVLALNSSVSIIDSLPHSYTEGIVVSDAQVFVLLVMILSFFKYRKKKMIHLGLISVLLFVGLYCYRVMKNAKMKRIVVYDTHSSTAIDFISSGKSLFYADTSFLKDSRKINFLIRGNRWHTDVGSIVELADTLGSIEVEELSFAKRNHFIQFHKTFVAIISPINSHVYSETPMVVDFVIVSGNPKCCDEKVLLSYKCSKVIFDSSNKKWNINDWVNMCKRLGLQYHSVPHNGAFVAEL